MRKIDSELKKFHKVSYFLGSLAHGAEKNLGKGSLSICMLAGKKFGKEAVNDVEVTEDPIKAVEVLKKALEKRGIIWEFEPFLGERESVIEEEGRTKRLRLVFRTCMIRNALFTYGHNQKQSLCYMSHGVFAGAMEKVMPNATVRLEIIHAGRNACLKEMVWEEKK